MLWLKISRDSTKIDINIQHFPALNPSNEVVEMKRSSDSCTPGQMTCTLLLLLLWKTYMYFFCLCAKFVGTDIVMYASQTITTSHFQTFSTRALYIFCDLCHALIQSKLVDCFRTLRGGQRSCFVFRDIIQKMLEQS